VREFELVDSNLQRDAQPVVFSYTGLWQHDTPLLDMLDQLYGERPLDSLGGSYGGSVRYRQVEGIPRWFGRQWPIPTGGGCAQTTATP